MRARTLLLFLLTAPTAAAGAASCDAPEFRQFDFWLGDWDVRAGGQPVGSNRIERAHDGCVLVEHWTGRSGVTGTSLNAFDAAAGRWRQTWVDSSGTVLLLEGGRVGPAMVLRGALPDPAAAGPAPQRLTWTPLPDGGVRQHWEKSVDGGTSWTTVFDGHYQRRGAAD
jgi:hypothetical protein